MSGVIQYSWQGAGEGYVRPGAAGVNIRSVNQTPRWWPKDYGNSSMIMSSGVQNRADSAQFSDAVKHAGVDAKRNL